MTDELLAPGHRACAGCGEVISVIQLLRFAGKNVVVACATGCMEITTTPFPETSWRVPWVHVAFENAAAVASGVAAALKKLGKNDVNVIALAGDGGTYDIGLQALSGMMERGDNVLFVCTDNEAYMNTGIQRSGATPMFAATTTSPAGKVIPGKTEWKKNIEFIAAAHGIPYVASANIAFAKDFEMKVKKALSIRGPKFIHVMSPCPVGWYFDSAITVELAKLAVETGMWTLFEIENGVFKRNYVPKELKPLKDYLKLQRRFKHVTDAQIAIMDERLKKSRAEMEKLEKSGVDFTKL
jgi:pyruvate ferredoxin oxidoreductase beta subunit